MVAFYHNYWLAIQMLIIFVVVELIKFMYHFVRMVTLAEEDDLLKALKKED